MEGLTRKLTSVAIAALLLLWVVFPVPVNIAALDRYRYEKALANPGIALAGSASYAAGVVILAGAGIVVAANTLDEWAPQGERLVNDFVNYVNANGYYNEYSGDLSQYLDATGQNVNLQQAYNDGIYDMLQQYLASESAREMLYSGTSTAGAPRNSGFSINGNIFPSCSAIPYALAIRHQASASNWIDEGFTPIAYKALEVSGTNGQYQSMCYLFAKANEDGQLPVQLGYISGNMYVNLLTNAGADYRAIKCNYDTLNGTFGGSATIWRRAYEAVAAYRWYQDASGWIVFDGAPITFDGIPVEQGMAASHYSGVYQPELVNQRIAEIANGAVQKVHVINPTAEQLETGLTYQDIISAQLSGISTGVEGLDTSVNTLIGVASSIATMISSTLLGQYCATVTSWLGETPFGNIMATVIDGVTDIPGHVDDAAQTVAGGVAALPGAIEGVLEGLFPNSIAIPGILQGTLEGVQAIPGTIADVVTAVQTGVLDITGAIESVMQPSPNLPRLNDEPVAIALPPAFQANIQEDLRERVPFCYLVHMQEALQGLSGNLSYSSGSGLRAQSNYDMRSFYFDVEIPYAGEVRFDAEPFLSQSFGALDIATTIRILVSVLLCYGLLFRAYKVVERAF